MPHARSMGTLNSGHLPENLLDAIQAKKDNYVFFARSGQNGLFFKVKGEQSVLSKAKPRATLRAN